MGLIHKLVSSLAAEASLYNLHMGFHKILHFVYPRISSSGQLYWILTCWTGSYGRIDLTYVLNGYLHLS